MKQVRNWKCKLKKLLQTDMFWPILCILLLGFTFYYFCCYDCLCDILHLSNRFRVIPCYFGTTTFFVAWYFLQVSLLLYRKTPCMIVIPPHISFLSNMYLLLTNNFTMEEQVVGEFRLDLDERNIAGGHNTLNLVYFSMHNWIGWWVVYQGWR